MRSTGTWPEIRKLIALIFIEGYYFSVLIQVWLSLFQSDVRQLWRRASSAIKHCFRRCSNQEDYDSDDDESLRPFRQSPNSGLKRSSSTPPLAPEYIQRLPPPYPLIEQLSARTGSECSRSESQVAGSQHSRSRSREQSSGGRFRKEDTYGWALKPAGFRMIEVFFSEKRNLYLQLN